MNTPQKTNALQAYQIILYDRALHPELFALKGRRVVRHESWELDAWVMQGQHVLRFESGSVCASELVTDQEAGLPTTGAVSAFLCAGERDFEYLFGSKRTKSTLRRGAKEPAIGGSGPNGVASSALYMTTVQTEALSENLYIATCDEMTAHAKEKDSLIHSWQEEAGAGMSILDIEKHSREVHIQAYHLLPTGGIVIRTQTIFEQR